MSSTATSGSRWGALSRACRPLVTVATTSKSVASVLEMAFKIAASSSTRRTVGRPESGGVLGKGMLCTATEHTTGGENIEEVERPRRCCGWARIQLPDTQIKEWFVVPERPMNDDVSFSIRQMDGAWRLMCAGGPNPVAATAEGIQYIFSGVPIGFFNLAVLTGSGLSADALGTR